MAKKNVDYDLIIIGAGSAGYAAGMYAGRFRLKTLIIGAELGGTLAQSHRVENYPGTISASGKEIMDRFKEHAEVSGCEIMTDYIVSVEKFKDYFTIKTISKKEITSSYLLITTGASHKHLGVTGEKEFFGRGVSYCATCDGMFFTGKNVIVVGGGNTALTQALYLSDICKEVYLIHRSANFKCETCWLEEANKKENIKIFIIEEVVEIVGDVLGMTGVKLKSGSELKADGIFISVGTIPNTKLVDGFAPKKDKEGCLIVDQRQETSIKGLYAAGDITTNSNKFRQAITAAAEGCVAASSIQEDYMKSKNPENVLLRDLEFVATVS